MLSVIVPVYNAEKFLARCLDSLLEQGVEDYEIVCVNDGSTDGSGEILQRYKRKNPTVIKVLEQENRGLPAARNEGMRIARGDVLAFCDADDYLVPGAYRYLLETFWTEDTELLRFDSVTLDRKMLKTWKEKDELEGGMLFEGDACDFLKRGGRCLCFVWSYLYRKSFLMEHGIAFRALKQCEDTAFNLDVYMCNPHMRYVNANVYRYMTSEGQVTRCREAYYLRDAVESYVLLFEKMKSYARQYPQHAWALNRYVELEMMPCFSRVLSVKYSKAEMLSLRGVLWGMEVLPMRSRSMVAWMVNAVMNNYVSYFVACVLYRYFFIPYILPRLSRN